MNEDLKALIRALLPERAIDSLKSARDALTPLRQAGPIVQMYVNDGEIGSFASFNNFMSFLNAGVETAGNLDLRLHDRDGCEILRKRLRIGHFGNRSIDIADSLRAAGKTSELGIVTMAFVPDRPRLPDYKKFGLVSSHFFMFYRGRDDSVAMVHPSSTLEPIPIVSGAFVSNQVVDSHGLEGVTLYQCNPGYAPHTLTLGLQDAWTGEVITSEVCELPPLGVRKIVFDTGSFDRSGRTFRVFTSSLPTSNSKPMLCRRYSGGRFSMSHA